MACDALALAAFPEDRIEYAETLLGLSAGSRTGVPALALGVSTGTPSSLERRLSMIVSTNASGKLSRAGIVLAGLLAVAAFPGWTYGQDDDERPARKKVAVGKKLHDGDDAAGLAADLHKLAAAA